MLATNFSILFLNFREITRKCKKTSSNLPRHWKVVWKTNFEKTFLVLFSPGIRLVADARPKLNVHKMFTWRMTNDECVCVCVCVCVCMPVCLSVCMYVLYASYIYHVRKVIYGLTYNFTKKDHRRCSMKFKKTAPVKNCLWKMTITL